VPPTYIKELNRYLVYHEMQEIATEESMLANLKTYFSDNFDSEKTAPKDKRAAPTMRSALSVMKKFWRYSQRGDLKQLAPLIADKLNTWEKEHTTCKAPIYSLQDLGKRSHYI
jgi:asparagine synthetase A